MDAYLGHYGTIRRGETTCLYLDNGDQLLMRCPHDFHRLLTASAEHALNARDPHPIHYITCQPEWHRLRGRQRFSLLKGHTQVNVDELCRVGVDENVLDVTVP